MDSWVPRSDNVWRDSATESGAYCKFAKIRGLITSMTDDSMIRCIEPGSLESWRLAARMLTFIDDGKRWCSGGRFSDVL